MPIKDGLVAATALVRGLTVVTQNRVGFEKAGLAPTVALSRIICRSR